MKPVVSREVARRFQDQHGVISRAQLQALGVSRAVVRTLLASGQWEELGPKVVRLAGTSPTPEQDLLGLCLRAGPAAIASNLSAAWLWQLTGVPARHAVTVPRTFSGRTIGGEVHRPRDFPAQMVVLRRIPCTNPLRTIVDVAGVSTPDELEGILDRALAGKLVTVEAVDAELGRMARQGRPGGAALREALSWRRSMGISHASVLESRALRLLHRAGLKPLAVEVKVADDLDYRVDILLRPGLAMEVDGYAYHHSAEQMADDARRRNRLFLSGTQVLVYTWRDITHDGHRVLAEVAHALARAAR
jgi:very-short-patch-repair endonuclease